MAASLCGHHDSDDGGDDDDDDDALQDAAAAAVTAAKRVSNDKEESKNHCWKKAQWIKERYAHDPQKAVRVMKLLKRAGKSRRMSTSQRTAFASS